MLDFLILHNSKEFFTREAMNSHTRDTSQMDDNSLSYYKETVDHLLSLIKAFFERRMFDGKNLFRVLSKCCEQEDIRVKIFELVFLICFMCKDLN
jgi:hypothetical protein